MKNGSVSAAVLRTDYKPYPWVLDAVRLDFDIGAEATVVRSELDFSRNPAAEPSGQIRLNGQAMELLRVALDGRQLGQDEFRLSQDHLLIENAPEKGKLSIEVRIRPYENTALEGLYPSGAFLLTQCEAEGFRKITYFPDRPDVMMRYDVTITADKTRYPVLLSNGNAVAAGDCEGNRHWVRWVDPHAKPCYLFALVAGDLAHVEDHFVTRGGRDVTLRVYVEKENIDRCEHAMQSLIHSMKWDEDRFGLEYDLDIYNIVATNDFNMGAMENKSLNIFNSKYVLARPDTATDNDYQAIEGVIGHEYFHNWTGNRVTCRDWFQLTLKEGLTVFRDQEFSSDMQSRAVKRIRDVRDLRNRQFPEDTGPMAHPIRPDKYIEVNNFYTMTVYQKGAAIIRMYHTLLGEEGFQKGMKLYFERHDGHAVTCDDFLAAMADANEVNLERFGRWYGQSGTPEVSARCEYDSGRSAFTLHLEQRTPPTRDQKEKQSLVIPFRFGLLSPAGQEFPLQLQGEDAPAGPSRVLILEDAQQSWTFVNVPERPVPSLLRDFSAPVKLKFDYSNDELALLMAHDSDPFQRWEAAQRLAQATILGNRSRFADGDEMALDPSLTEAFDSLLKDRTTDPALLAEALMLPSEEYLSDQMEVVDVEGIHAAREFVKRGLAEAAEEDLRSRYDELNDGAAYDKSSASMARRSLKNMCLAYLVELEGGDEVARRQLEDSDNMTDTLAALKGLVWSDSDAADGALAEFEGRWKDDPLVMDKWFTIQAVKPGAETIQRVRNLMGHPSFSLTNPNKVRSLVGAFAMANPTGFHAADGEGYRFHADQVIALNALNPQIAARMASAFNTWTRYDAGRRTRIKAQLERIAATEGLSPDVYEIVSKALSMEGHA
jgi:aminopeptidase N